MLAAEKGVSMDFGLDDEQDLVVSTIRKLVDRDFARWAADADRAGEPPEKLLAVAGEVGFLVDAVPADRGGMLEGDYAHLVRALRAIELGRGCAALAALLESNVEPALAVARWGSDAARAALFDSLGDGGLATTAHDYRRRLTVVDDGGGLRLDGELGPVPVLAAASHLLLLAYAGDRPVVALLPTASATVTPVTPSGWRAARWGQLGCQGVTVPAELVLARGDDAAAAAAEILTWYRVGLAARAVGVAFQSMVHAKAYAAERIQFDQPIGRFESLIHMRDDSDTAAAAARLLVLEAAWQIDRGHPAAADTASRARALAAQVVGRATIDAVQILGGYGFVNDYPVEKLMRDARAFDVLAGHEPLVRVLAERSAS